MKARSKTWVCMHHKRHRRKSETHRERERAQVGERETEKERREGETTLNHTHTENKQRNWREKSLGDRLRERQRWREAAKNTGPWNIVHCTKEWRERLEHLQPVLHPMGKSMPHNISQIWILDPAVPPGSVNSYVLSWANCTAIDRSKRSITSEGQVVIT